LEAPQTLIEFHYRLSALRRELENTVTSANPSNSVKVPLSELRQVGLRFRQTLEPSLKAIEALAPLVADHAEIEAHARISYYETRPNSDLTKTLKERIEALLAEWRSLEDINKKDPRCEAAQHDQLALAITFTLRPMGLDRDS